MPSSNVVSAVSGDICPRTAAERRPIVRLLLYSTLRPVTLPYCSSALAKDCAGISNSRGGSCAQPARTQPSMPSPKINAQHNRMPRFSPEPGITDVKTHVLTILEKLKIRDWTLVSLYYNSMSAASVRLARRNPASSPIALRPPRGGRNQNSEPECDRPTTSTTCSKTALLRIAPRQARKEILNLADFTDACSSRKATGIRGAVASDIVWRRLQGSGLAIRIRKAPIYCKGFRRCMAEREKTRR